jgi:outer membrane protein TolC
LGPAAQENLNIQQQAFTLGEVGIQIVLDEKRRLSEKQEAELKALQLALETYSRLEVATGGVLALSGGTP